MENLRNKKINLNEIDPVNENIQISSLIDGKFNEYKIKEDKLLLNPYNDRFAKERSQSEELNENNPDKILFSKEVQEKIADLIWNINEPRNKKTLKDIENIGMQRPIVIDASGLVIDGNRRVTIIRKILKKNLSLEKRNKLEKINCRVIPKILDKETIFEYETKLQIGEDQKLDYDPINIYLKINKLLKERLHLKDDAKYKQVADLMGSKYKKNQIKTYKETFDVMEDYLNLIGKKNNYMKLEHREDQFKFFSNFWNKLENNKFESNNFDFKDKNNRFDIRKICYALINQQVEGKIFREIFPKEKVVSGPLTSKKSLEYLKKKLKIDKKNNESFEEWANNEDLNFRKGFLKSIINTSKKISFDVNKEDNQDNEAFIDDILKKVDKLNKKLKKTKHKDHNKKFLKAIQKIKDKINEIINDIKKDRY